MLVFSCNLILSQNDKSQTTIPMVLNVFILGQGKFSKHELVVIYEFTSVLSEVGD